MSVKSYNKIQVCVVKCVEKLVMSFLDVAIHPFRVSFLTHFQKM